MPRPSDANCSTPRIGSEITLSKDKLADLEATHAEWQEILTLAATLAARCDDAYRKADDPTRRLFNQAVFDKVETKDGHVTNTVYRERSTDSSA